MTDQYAYLFYGYAHDVQLHLKDLQKETHQELVQIIPMSDEHKIDLIDKLDLFRSRCCLESFALGVEAGMRLIREIMAS